MEQNNSTELLGPFFFEKIQCKWSPRPPRHISPGFLKFSTGNRFYRLRCFRIFRISRPSPLSFPKFSKLSMSNILIFPKRLFSKTGVGIFLIFKKYLGVSQAICGYSQTISKQIVCWQITLFFLCVNGYIEHMFVPMLALPCLHGWVAKFQKPALTGPMAQGIVRLASL